MSKADILEELPRLGLRDRREILERIWELEERDLLQGAAATPEEKAILDRELEEYRLNSAGGSPWEEVEARIRKSSLR